MKHKIWLRGLLTAILIIFVSFGEPGLSGTCAASSARTDYTQIYKPILEDFREIIISKPEMSYDHAMMAVIDATRFNTVGEALDMVGYTIMDVSGDGIPELLIGSVGDDFSSVIYALYTCRNGVLPVLNFTSMYRNGYTMIGEGRFLYFGSNGAIYSIFGDYEILPDGTSLICRDFYFTYEKDPDLMEIGFYHNTSGVYNKDDSEELKISDEQFSEIFNSLKNREKKIKFTPFSEYSGADNTLSHSAGRGPVFAIFAANPQKGVDYADEFFADVSEYQAKILFSTDKRVRDFKVLSLLLVNDGFETRELYTLGDLKPGKPFLLGMTFWGDMPSYGVSYVDDEGVARRFSISQSGMDGSLVLSAF